MKLILVAAMAVFVAIAIWLVAKFKNDRVTMWCGLALVAFGLAASLLVPTKLFLSVDQEAATYLSNTFIIVASVGANLIASAALMSSNKDDDRYIEQVYFQGEFYVKRDRER